MAADPWAIVSDGAPSADADPWAVVSHRKPEPPEPGPPHLPAGYPVVSARPRSLRERFSDNFEEGRRSSLAGAGADAMAVSVLGPHQKERNADAQDAYAQISEADPWYRAPGGVGGKTAAGLATLAGTMAGGLPSPESWVGFESGPAKAGFKELAKTTAKGMAKNFAFGAATDPAVQAEQNAAGTHEGFDPWRPIVAGAANALIPVTMQGAGAAARSGGRIAATGARKAADALGPALDSAGRRIEQAVEGFDGSRHIPTRELGGDEWAVVHAPEPSGDAPPTPQRRPRASAQAAASPTLDVPQARAIVSEVLPGARHTSGYRDPAHNSEVGGVPNSYHTRNGGQATDFIPPKGANIGKFKADLIARGFPVAELLDEGDHWHLAWHGAAAPQGQPAAAAPEFLPGVPERSLAGLPDAGGDAAQAIRSASDEPVGLADRQAAERASAKAPGASAGSDQGPARPQFLDDNHARLYDLGKAAEAGQVDNAQAASLADTMARHMDWSDIPLTQRERTVLAEQGKVHPKRMIEAARDFVKDADAPENAKAHVSYYDPDAYPAAMAEARREPVARPLPDFPEHLEPTSDNGGLSGVSRPAADLPDAGAVVRFTHGGQRIEGVVSPRLKSGRYIVSDERGNLYAVHPADMIHTGKTGRWQVPTQLDTSKVPDVLSSGKRAASSGEPLSTDRLGMGDTGGTGGRLAAIDLSHYGDAIRGATTPPSRESGLRGAPRSSAAKVGEGSPDYAKQTVSSIAERLRSTLGLTQRQGRLTLKGGAVGEYDPRSGIIRTRAARHAMTVLAHESGHALQHRRTPALAAAIDRYAREVEAMAYEGANPAHKREEGFAEFVRLYLTSPETARLDAPNFYHAFEEALANDLPPVARDFGAIQKAYKDLLKAASLDVASSSVALTGKPGRLKALVEAYQEAGLSGLTLRVADEAYRGVFDQKHPFNVWLREVQRLARQNGSGRLNIEAADSPYVLARMADHAFAVGQSDLQHGITPYRGVDPEGPSLSDVNQVAFGKREPSPEEDAQFAAYLISRRMRHEWDRHYRGELENPPDKAEHDKAFHERVVEDAEALHPHWKEAAELATTWNRNQWKLERDAGFISEKTHDAGVKDHPDYVPLQRDMSDRNAPGGGGRARGVGQFAGGVKEFVGSERDIIHPMVSMARRAFELRAAIARNEVVGAMRNAAKRAGDNAGHLIEELPAKQFEKISVDAMQALDAVAKAMGLSERDRSTFSVFQQTELEGAIQAELFRQVEFSPRKDEAVVFHWRDGKKTPLLLPDGKLGRDLFTALSGMTKDTRALWEEIAAGAAQALRLGVTGVPEFALKTSMRDQFAAAILTDVGFIPYVDSARGLGHELAKSQVAKRYQAAGGLKGGVNLAATRRPFPRDDVQAKAQLQRYRGKHLPITSWRDAMHLVDIGDTATRIGVFSKALQRAKKRGLSDYEAVVEARHISADFFDPSRHGAWAGVVQAARTIPFFNSGLQGPDVMVRVIRHAFEKPETLRDKQKFRAAWWALGMLGASSVLGLTVVAANHKDPDFQNINDQVRATHWPLFKRATGEWVLYPKSFELGMPSNLTERAYSWLVDKDPRTLERIWKDISATMLPTHDATALTVPFQVAKNRDRGGRPIVPDNLRGTVDPQFQVNNWTSATAKKLAGNVMSPAILEHYITGFLGTGGRDALALSDMAIAAAKGEPSMKGRAPDMYLTRGFVRRTARGSDSEEHFWSLAAKDGRFERAAGSLRAILKTGDDAKAEAYLKGLPPEARDYAESQVVIGGKLAKANPIVRARTAMGVLGAMRRENKAGALVGVDNRPIALTPSQRRTVDDALDDLALVEAHNSMVAAGVNGWTQRDFMDRREPLDRLAKAAPPVAQAVNLRLVQEGVLPIRSAASMWTAAKQTMDAMSPATRQALYQRSRMNTGTERRSEVRRIGAGTAPARGNIFAKPAPAKPSDNMFPRPDSTEQQPMVANLFRH